MRYLSTSLLFLFSFIASSQGGNPTVVLDNTILEAETLIDTLDIPWDMKFTPDGKILVTERYGRVCSVDPVSFNHAVVLDLSDSVQQTGESGLLGLEVYEDDAIGVTYAILAYTYYDQNNTFLERIVKYEYTGTSLVNPVILLDSIVAASTHDGCRLLILPDNTLLITTGDASDSFLAQDYSSLNGKTLRIGLDGSIPSDNPFPGSPLYSWGHRNHQGLAFGPNNKIFISEHGTSNDDEFQELEMGRNYGWPYVEGFCDLTAEQQFCADSAVKEPITVWTPTVAPSDLAWYSHSDIPEFENKMLMASLKSKTLFAISFDTLTLTLDTSIAYLVGEFGRIRDVMTGPNGEIYIATNGQTWSNTNPFTHQIIKLSSTNVSIAENKSELKLYPNPSKTYMFLESQNIGQAYQIFSADGKLMYSGTTHQQKTTLPINNLLPGIYFLNLAGNTIRFIKE